jgi:toxic protein SymE
MTMENIRKLKIHTKLQPRQDGAAEVPEIRLEGKWLENLGFEQGKTVTIIQEVKRLVITVDDKRRKS